jgi:ABC-type uncharacterized transport system permease subunit
LACRFFIGAAVSGIAMARDNRARHAAVFATIAGAIHGAVVARNRLEGRFSAHRVDVTLVPGASVRQLRSPPAT